MQSLRLGVAAVVALGVGLAGAALVALLSLLEKDVGLVVMGVCGALAGIGLCKLKAKVF